MRKLRAARATRVGASPHAVAGAAAVLLAATTAAVLVVASAQGALTKTVVFTASYSGQATVKVSDNVADIVVSGSGQAAVLGAGKVTGHGKGDTTGNPACVPFSGPGAISGGKGTLAFTVLPGAGGCGDEQGQVFTVTGKAKVTKGTGALAKAKGLLKFTGVYDRGAGTFSVKFKGTLTR